MSLLKTGTNCGEFWLFQKIANLSARKKKNDYVVRLRVHGNWPRLACSCKVVLSVLATTRASGISRHRFWARPNVVDNRWVPSGALLRKS